MPKTRVVANFILTLVMKLVSGYWNINDPANGQLVVDARKLDEFFFIEASDDFAFESSILIYFAKRDGKIAEFNVPAIYNESRSHVNLLAYYPKFFVLCTRWGCARISFQYIASNINLGSLYLLGTVVFGGFGSFWGGWHWISGAATGNPATAGSVGIALLSLLVSFASFFAFINLDAKRNPGTSLGRAVHDTRR